jgi:transcriptional regulator with XRE-family HTH domain
VSTTERIRDRSRRRSERLISVLAEEFRDKRLATGLSQREVASGVGISRPTYTRIENAQSRRVSVEVLCGIAACLGLDLAVNVYPGPEPLRDGPSTNRLRSVLENVASPLSYATEVALRTGPGRRFEQRAWDAVISGSGKRTGVELEMRLRDAQAVERRLNLKRHDDPVDHFVLLVADTKHNRAVLREHPALFRDLARLTRLQLVGFLKAGLHPPDALVLV